jgi:L-cysteine/cystine lyase
MTVDEARAEFPVLQRLAYLNAGTNGPIARSTVEAMIKQERADLETGRGGKAYFDRASELRDEVRRKLAAVIGVAEDNVALATSTTNGCNIVLAGLGLGPDDEIVTTDGEHFGLLGSLAASPARVRVAAVRQLPPEQALDVLLREVGPKTRLLALSHVCWMSGNRFPVAELKETTGLPILVDGAQSAGAIPLDVSAFDFYAASCQKWLCGPDTTGVLYVASPEALGIAAPSYLAQKRYEPSGEFEPRAGAPRFDPGWTAPPTLAGLSAALDLAPEGRFERAAETAARCRDLLSERFVVITAPGQGTLISFRAEGDSAQVVARLYEQDVIVRDVPEQGWIRVSCGWWTSDSDLERLMQALG